MARPMTETSPEKQVLIVEDDNSTFHMLSVALRNAGFIVTGATSMKLAERSLELSPPDAVVVDLGLPGNNGGEDFIIAIRTSLTLKNIPIVVHTGQQLSRHGNYELARDAVAVIQKNGPTSTQLVVDAINTALSNRL